MKVISITGYKGGVGKSTVSLHLANYLSSVGKTLLIDGDQNETCLKRAEKGLLSFEVCSRFDQSVGGKLFDGVDFLLVDTAARPTGKDLQELGADSDLIILPTTPGIDTLFPLTSLISQISEFKYRVIINLVPPYPSKSGSQLYSDLVDLEFPVFKQFIRRSVAFEKASERGVCVDKIPRYRAIWNDFKAVGKELLEVL